MTTTVPPPIDIDREQLRTAIQAEYAEVALHPTKGFHFHTGRRLARLLGYEETWLVGRDRILRRHRQSIQPRRAAPR